MYFSLLKNGKPFIPKIILFFTLLPLILASCQPNQQQTVVNKYLNAVNLQSQFATINVHNDTTLKLSGGTQIFIPKDALKSLNDTLRLEIKEALTSMDILLAGLFTQNNGKALSSDGMIYIAPAKGEKATINKPLTIKIPSKDANDKMQLFKGTPKPDGINWDSATPVTIKVDSSYEIGKAIFSRNCASCHNPEKDATGPSLYGSPQRWENKEDMYAFIHNPSKLIASGHHYANCLYDTWNKTAMTAFPSLTEKELDNLFLYVEKEGRKRLGADTARYTKYGYAKCKALLNKSKQLANQLTALSQKREKFTALEGPLTAMQTTIENGPATKALVQPNTDYADYYNIQINTFGWYNIDAFATDMPGFKESDLSVTLNHPGNVKTDILLFIPSVKMVAHGGLLNDGKTYGFFEMNGKAPLPQNVPAYIIAMGEGNDKKQLYVAITAFNVAEKQSFTMTLQTTDSVSMLQKMRALRLDGVSYKIKEDTAAIQSKQVEKDYSDLLLEIHDHCDCYNDPPVNEMSDSARTR